MRNLYKIKIENANTIILITKLIMLLTKRKKVIKNLLCKKNRTAIGTVIFDHVECKDKFDIADNFNRYFINSIKTIKDEINNVQYVNVMTVINSKFKYREITLEELKKIK